MRRRRARPILAVALGLALPLGCDTPIFPGTSTPPRLFVLTPKSTYPQDLPAVDWQLTVDVPIAQAGLNTQRIAVRRNPVSLEYWARANWIDTAPIMVQTLLVESFENSGRIVSVGRQSIALRPDYVLITELREFQAEYFDDGPPQVRVRLNAKLVQMPERVIIGATTAERLARARVGRGRSELHAVVDAFDEALGKVLKQVVIWTLQTPGRRGA